MDIHLKYNIGDRVWAMINNRPRSFTIDSIKINKPCTIDSSYEHSNDIELLLNVTYIAVFINGIKDKFYTFTKYELFGSFEELRDNVFNEEIKNKEEFNDF